MRTWFALIVVPALALLDQSVAYAATVWACEHQNSVVVHAVHAPFLLAALLGIAIAWDDWRGTAPGKDVNDTIARRHFIAGVATGASALSALVILAMWGVTWVLRSCVY